jgi:hypothetical protein
METFANFDDIPQQIAKQRGASSAEVVVSVAWFTDPELFDLLCRQAGRGIRVSVAVLDDQINIGAGRLNFARLSDMAAARSTGFRPVRASAQSCIASAA